LGVCGVQENLCDGAADDDDGFFDMLTRSQSRRLDDQRCTFMPTNSSSQKEMDNTDELLDILQKLNDRYVVRVKKCSVPIVCETKTMNLFVHI